MRKPFFRLNSFYYSFNSLSKSLPALNLTETRGVIITSSPVFGLRANRSDCCQGTKDPNPFMEIDSPSRIPFATTVGNAFTTVLTTFFGNPVSSTRDCTNSPLFILDNKYTILHQKRVR